MHIVTAKSDTPNRAVSWFLMDRPTTEMLFGFELTDLQREKTRWMSVVAVVPTGSSPPRCGVSWTSKKDDFNVGTGMTLALERALQDPEEGRAVMSQPERADFWKFVFENERASELIRDPIAQHEWLVSAAATLRRRGNALYQADYRPPFEGPIEGLRG